MLRSFGDAYEGYGTALRIDEDNIAMTSKLLCNRAIAALKLIRFEHAIQDASAALFFNPQYAKAYATRAAAHVELDRYTMSTCCACKLEYFTPTCCSFDEAESDYERAIELEPWEREHGRQLQLLRSRK